MKLYFLIFLATLFSDVISLPKSGRIVGGNVADAGQFPYVAAIHVTTSVSKIFCGGALLGDQWIVSSAQCLEDGESFIIQLGSTTLTKIDPNRKTLASSEYIIHPNYDPITLDSDIGLIKLRMPVELSDYLKPVYSVPVSEMPEGWRVLSLGWGQISNNDPELAENLNWVALDSLSNDECKITYGSAVTDNMLCAAGNYNEGTCIGDTGSPLVYLVKFGNALLYGVASFVSGNGCESPDPSGYTRVYPFADWIVNITGVKPR